MNIYIVGVFVPVKRLINSRKSDGVIYYNFCCVFKLKKQDGKYRWFGSPLHRYDGITSFEKRKLFAKSVSKQYGYKIVYFNKRRTKKLFCSKERSLDMEPQDLW